MKFNFLVLIDVLTQANHSQIQHKALRALFNLWVIRRSLHIDKKQKIKFHSYKNIVKVIIFLCSSFSISHMDYCVRNLLKNTG